MQFCEDSSNKVYYIEYTNYNKFSNLLIVHTGRIRLGNIF